jgi:uncharacterized MAPEG superfamily protein
VLDRAAGDDLDDRVEATTLALRAAAVERRGCAPVDIAGRLERTLRNFVETFSLFAAAVLIAHVTNTHRWMKEWGVQLYFGSNLGRVAYLASHATGAFLLRSLVWNVATLGIAMVLLSLV